MNEKVKDIARSMITASHYNNLPEVEFEGYLNEILQLCEEEIRKDERERISQKMLSDPTEVRDELLS